MNDLERPDFGRVRELITQMEELKKVFGGMFSQTDLLEGALKAGLTELLAKKSAGLLRDIPVNELKNAKAGIRTGLLTAAGYENLGDLYRASDEELYSIDGMGEKQVSVIRVLTREFLLRLSERQRIRPEDLEEISGVPSGQGGASDTLKPGELICVLARYRKARIVLADAESLRLPLETKIDELTGKIIIRNRVRWFFSGRRAKEDTLSGISALMMFEKSGEVSRAKRLAGLFAGAVSTGREEALEDYRENSAAYYALIDKFTGTGIQSALRYGSVPATLAEEIDRTELDGSLFRGDLRSYQAFGARFVLCQKRVLLGDEMGLGKTIQAVAVMAHLTAQDPAARFLVICPASVMINWCREIEKFSAVRSYLVHGDHMDAKLSEWLRGSGAAVTNYESMGRIIGRIDEKVRLAMLVVDEAHYIKNPDAQRTQYIRRLGNDADHILLMTGTPLENRVEEMCELVRFIRPDMARMIMKNAVFRNVPAFREMVSPVYLRRQTDQVLGELPPMNQSPEWCLMTAQDEAAYRTEVLAGNFMGMRRVSFLQEDLAFSAKGTRLLELCTEGCEDGKKIVIFSYFRETIRKVHELIESAGISCVGEITGSIPAAKRQELIDRFKTEKEGCVLICQVQAGGTGVNIQTASVVIFCEPQIKPSLTKQAIARVYRMGQIRSVLVCHLLCAGTVDEAVMEILEDKEAEFDLFADESEMARAEEQLADREWISEVVRRQQNRYLPVPVTRESGEDPVQASPGNEQITADERSQGKSQRNQIH